MTDLDLSFLQRIVKADGTTVWLHSKHGTTHAPRPERSVEGKISIVRAVELPEDGGPRRLRLRLMGKCGSELLRVPIADTIASGARIITDSCRGHSNFPKNPHEARSVGNWKAYGILEWLHWLHFSQANEAYQKPRRDCIE